MKILHLVSCFVLHFSLGLLNLCWLIAFGSVRWLVTALTSGVTSGRDHLEDTLLPAVLWVMPQGDGTNQIGVERRSSSFIGHTLHSASPHYPFPTQPLPFPFHSFPHFLYSVIFHHPSCFLLFQIHFLPNMFFFWCHTFEHKPFLLFSCVVAVNNGKMSVALWKILPGFVLVLLPHHNSPANGCLLPNAEAWISISASMVTLPELSGTER